MWPKNCGETNSEIGCVFFSALNGWGFYGVMKSWGYSPTWTSNHQEDDDQAMNSMAKCGGPKTQKPTLSITKKKHQSYPSASSYHPGEKGQNAIILIIAGLVYIPFYTKLISFLSRRVSNPGSSDQSILISRDYLHLSPILMLQRTHPVRQVENSSFNPRVSLWSSPHEKNLHNHSV